MTADATGLRSGIDLSALDQAVRPQDDLYRHVNGRWLAQHEIPADRAMDGAFRALHDLSEERVRAIITDLAATEDLDPASTPAKIGALYASFLDTERVERLGTEAVAAELAQVAGAATPAELVDVLGGLQRTGGGGAVAFYVDNDAKDPETYVTYLVQGGLGLPDEAYYREDQYAPVREKYAPHLARMLRLAGVSADSAWGAEPEDAAARVLALETKLAAHHWDVVRDRDADLTYNPMTLADLVERLNADLDAYKRATPAD